MSYDDNKIRRRKVSSRNSISKPVVSDKTYDKQIQKKSINRDSINRNKQSYTREVERENTREDRRNRAKKSRNLKILKGLLVAMLISLVVVSTIGFSVVFSVVKDSPKVTKELVQSNYISNEAVSIDDMPINLKNAIVAIEDERFYKHNGVDIISLTRSVLNNFFTDTTQGGSTIDMQVSKNLLTSEEKTMQRKIIDIYNALQMNKVMSKDEILEAYLNNIYLGRSSYGVASGAKAFFGKNVSDLSLAECAMLVGITNNPARYMEHRQAKKRQETVLYKMYELGYITENEYKKAKREPVPFVSEIGK
ncbi:MAG: transglycosylase domain-containing protein [Romboutsia sp.]|uniref:transglycosylase domain-containing protein n=1 Tax=Romboutsia sp. TaxID=1965302 RepID=UPI003F2E7477